MQRAGQADQSVQCWLGRPCLVAANLVDVQANQISKALLRQAELLAELNQAGGEIHRDRPFGDRAHTVSLLALKLLTHPHYAVVSSNIKRARNFA